MLVFCFILLTIMVIIFFLFTTVRIKIKYNKNQYNIMFYGYLFNRVKYFKLKLDKDIISNLIKKEYKKIKKVNLYRAEQLLFRDTKIIKRYADKYKINLEYLNLDVKIGTEFILLTSVIIITLSAIFPLLINKVVKKYNHKNCSYKFIPIYDKNKFELSLDCIISVKLVHIISVIFKILLRKGDFKNVRSSNTRFNDNCYE